MKDTPSDLMVRLRQPSWLWSSAGLVSGAVMAAGAATGLLFAAELPLRLARSATLGPGAPLALGDVFGALGWFMLASVAAALVVGLPWLLVTQKRARPRRLTVIAEGAGLAAAFMLLSGLVLGVVSGAHMAAQVSAAGGSSPWLQAIQSFFGAALVVTVFGGMFAAPFGAAAGVAVAVLSFGRQGDLVARLAEQWERRRNRPRVALTRHDGPLGWLTRPVTPPPPPPEAAYRAFASLDAADAAAAAPSGKTAPSAPAAPEPPKSAPAKPFTPEPGDARDDAPASASEPAAPHPSAAADLASGAPPIPIPSPTRPQTPPEPRAHTGDTAPEDAVANAFDAPLQRPGVQDDPQSPRWSQSPFMKAVTRLTGRGEDTPQQTPPRKRPFGFPGTAPAAPAVPPAASPSPATSTPPTKPASKIAQPASPAAASATPTPPPTPRAITDPAARSAVRAPTKPPSEPPSEPAPPTAAAPRPLSGIERHRAEMEEAPFSSPPPPPPPQAHRRTMPAPAEPDGAGAEPPSPRASRTLTTPPASAPPPAADQAPRTSGPTPSLRAQSTLDGAAPVPPPSAATPSVPKPAPPATAKPAAPPARAPSPPQPSAPARPPQAAPPPKPPQAEPQGDPARQPQPKPRTQTPPARRSGIDLWREENQDDSPILKPTRPRR